MSTYKFTINKRSVVDLEDSSPYYGDPETHADSSTEINAQKDIPVTVYLDDVEKHSVTLTDAGATLQFDADVSEGEHTIRIVPQKDPIHQTDVCVDTFAIGDVTCVTTQYDFDSQILGTASTLRQKLSMGNAQPHNYVWYGVMRTADASTDLDGPFYRPKIVSDVQGEWQFTFTKTASGHIWTSNPGDTDDILYDSTAQHTYRFVAAYDHATVDAAYATYQNTDVLVADWHDSSTDSSTAYYSQEFKQSEIDQSPWQGPGTYELNSDNQLAYVNDTIDQSTETADRVVIFSLNEYMDFVKGRWYHDNYTVTSITVS